MALQSKIIKQKVRAIGSIQKITRTMEMVSVSKMRRTISRVGFSREYARLTLELMVNLSKTKKLKHPLLTERESGSPLCIVITSNKGLCGGYNARIMRKVTEFKREHPGMTVLPIGKYAEKVARSLGVPLLQVPVHFSEAMIADDARIFINRIVEQYTTKDYSSVSVIYTQFVRQLEYKPCVRQIVPVSPKVARAIIEEIASGSSDERFSKSSLSEYEFEPDPFQILNRAIPMLLGALFFQMCLESLASEHSSRMVAMKSATDSAGEILDDLRLSYNRARQAAITQEVSEIIGGANALAG